VTTSVHFFCRFVQNEQKHWVRTENPGLLGIHERSMKERGKKRKVYSLCVTVGNRSRVWCQPGRQHSIKKHRKVKVRPAFRSELFKRCRNTEKKFGNNQLKNTRGLHLRGQRRPPNIRKPGDSPTADGHGRMWRGVAEESEPVKSAYIS